MAPGVAKTFVKELYSVLDIKYEEYSSEMDEYTADGKLTNLGIKNKLKEYRQKNRLIMNDDGYAFIIKLLSEQYIGQLSLEDIQKVLRRAEIRTNEATHQAMEAVIHNLNSMHSRAGKVCVPELWETLGTAN